MSSRHVPIIHLGIAFAFPFRFALPFTFAFAVGTPAGACWNGNDWGMPNISSVQDWDNGPEGMQRPISE